VVVPASLLGQWQNEINKVTTKGLLRVFTYPGNQYQFVSLDDILTLGGERWEEGMEKEEKVILAPLVWKSAMEDVMVLMEEEEEEGKEKRKGDGEGKRERGVKVQQDDVPPRLYKAKVEG